jgi:hypothetical protein
MMRLEDVKMNETINKKLNCNEGVDEIDEFLRYSDSVRYSRI